MTASDSSTCSPRSCGTAIRAAPSRSARNSRARIDATAFASKAENRKEIAKAIAPQNYLNQPETVLEQILTGTYADGLGAVKKDPNRIDFDPFPWNQFAIWILSQMKRWGQLKADIDYAKVAAEVYLATDTAGMMKEMGLTPPDPSRKTIVVMGKAFDPTQPDAYVSSFAIKRS
jgi:nitrate/nitrite transport system substrate-binding protein